MPRPVTVTITVTSNQTRRPNSVVPNSVVPNSVVRVTPLALRIPIRTPIRTL